MKSLMLGIYKKKNVNTFKVANYFSSKNSKNVESIKVQNLELYFTSNNLIYNTENFIILFSGKPLFMNSPERFFSDFDINNIEKELLKISGIFSFCYYNTFSNTLYVANDFFGLYPIFIFEDNDVVIFGNEYQSIIQYSPKLKILNKSAVDEYFKYGFVLGRKTFFKEINNLAPRNIITISQPCSNYNSYAEFTPIEKPLTENEYLDLIYEAFKEFIAKFFAQTSGSKTITLTGGLDSRIILGLLSKELKKSNKFTSFYLEPLNQLNDKDVIIAKILAKAFDLELKIINGSEKTENLAASYFDFFRKADNESILTGLYGGELLAGLLFKSVIPADFQPDLNNKSIFHKLRPNKIQKEIAVIGKRAFYFEAMMSSFFTSIYSGTEGAWVHPWSNHLYYHSLFSDTAFLKIWFSIPESMFYSDTNFVFKMYEKFFPDLIKFPTNSILDGLSEAGFLFLTEGIEPKQVKKRKFNKNAEALKNMEGYKYIPSKYRNIKIEGDGQKLQRIIDFCYWHSHIYTC